MSENILEECTGRPPSEDYTAS